MTRVVFPLHVAGPYPLAAVFRDEQGMPGGTIDLIYGGAGEGRSHRIISIYSISSPQEKKEINGVRVGVWRLWW